VARQLFALGSLLAAKRGIAVTSAVGWSMLKGQGPHQVPTGSTFAPRACLEWTGTVPPRRREDAESRRRGWGPSGSGTHASDHRGPDGGLKTRRPIAGQGDRKRHPGSDRSLPKGAAHAIGLESWSRGGRHLEGQGAGNPRVGAPSCKRVGFGVRHLHGHKDRRGADP
jgi:hypothetical protein